MKSPQIVNYYSHSKLLRRSIFNPAGSFGQWVFFPFSPGLLCSLVRKCLQNVEKIARSPGGE